VAMNPITTIKSRISKTEMKGGLLDTRDSCGSVIRVNSTAPKVRKTCQLSVIFVTNSEPETAFSG